MISKISKIRLYSLTPSKILSSSNQNTNFSLKMQFTGLYHDIQASTLASDLISTTSNKTSLILISMACAIKDKVHILKKLKELSKMGNNSKRTMTIMELYKYTSKLYQKSKRKKELIPWILLIF